MRRFISFIFMLVFSLFLFNSKVNASCPGEKVVRSVPRFHSFYFPDITSMSTIFKTKLDEISCSYSISDKEIICDTTGAIYGKTYTGKYRAWKNVTDVIDSVISPKIDITPSTSVYSFSIAIDSEINCSGKESDDSGSGGSSSEDSSGKKPSGIDYDNDTRFQSNCKMGALGDPNNPKAIAYYLQKIFDVMKFLGPILVIVYTIKDLLTLTAEQKVDENIGKFGKTLFKRVVYAILLFLLPIILNLILKAVGLYTICIT